jgi:hypothetical protein
MAKQQTKGDHRRAQRDAGACALITRLESEIAASADQRRVLFKALDDAAVVEPHRDHHAYHLGADLHYCGLAAGDATAWMGLMSIGPANVGKLLCELATTKPHVYVGRVWGELIDARRNEFEARGRYVQWQRRWARYKVNAAGWARSAMHMTSGQRALVQDCATMLGVDLPQNLNRGAAHDWLRRHGANIVYRKEA